MTDLTPAVSHDLLPNLGQSVRHSRYPRFLRRNAPPPAGYREGRADVPGFISNDADESQVCIAVLREQGRQ
ncbi:hypothetical protein JGU71_20405 [Antrihabitans sp. YC3-6]|uniref:Uncharacterized protein n=1 Tax=Antrihabitans stalagmiti TaxID=2799499 RepID=A0A934U5A5_9NOCA|nr:hypothetical protein [Antrihabitans stalagmiti]MBJ8341251.1 hypothetical protein [Antrihabitans stalagmiti]